MSKAFHEFDGTSSARCPFHYQFQYVPLCSSMFQYRYLSYYEVPADWEVFHWRQEMDTSRSRKLSLELRAAVPRCLDEPTPFERPLALADDFKRIQWQNITKHQISSPLALSHMVASTGWPFNGQQQWPATMAIFVQPQVVADPLDLAQRSRFVRASARWSRSQRAAATARRRGHLSAVAAGSAAPFLLAIGD
jgi:hypothetical protein